MKKFTFSKRMFATLCAISFLFVPSYAFRTIVTTMLVVDSAANSAGVSAPVSANSSIKRKVHFNRQSLKNLPELDIAAREAEGIFSKALEDNGIDLVDIEAILEFDTIFHWNPEQVCRVEVIYSDSIFTNLDYYFIGQSGYSAGVPFMVPLALSNQGRGYGLIEDPGMKIWLNPNIPLHCDITPVEEDKYDAVTILLRALVVGCGLQSTFNNANMTFGQIPEGETQPYINVYDALMFQQNGGMTCADVMNEDITTYDFLAGNNICVNGQGTTITLYNEWNGGAGEELSVNTLNAIDGFYTYTADEWNSGFTDLLDLMSIGLEVREITPYTLSMLKRLGWMKTLFTGIEDPYASLHNSKLVCSDSILSQNEIYSLNLSGSNMVYVDNLACELRSMENDKYNIGTINFSTYSNQGTFSYNSLPSHIQWRRNPDTKNIIGQFHAEASQYVDGNMRQDKTFNFEIPYRPNDPLVEKSEMTNGGLIALHLKALANGSDTYTVRYIGVSASDIHTFTVETNLLDTTLYIPATQYYTVAVYGSNDMGNSDPYSFTLGYSAQIPLHLSTIVSGSTLRYDLSSNGLIDTSNIIINSVRITDLMGNLMIDANTTAQGDPINISSLSRGYYLLCVVADGQSYSKRFYKR